MTRPKAAVVTIAVVALLGACSGVGGGDKAKEAERYYNAHGYVGVTDCEEAGTIARDQTVYRCKDEGLPDVCFREPTEGLLAGQLEVRCPATR